MVMPVYKALKSGKQMPKVKFTWGSEDRLCDNNDLALSMYRKLGLDFDSEVIPGYKHEWDFWDLALRKAIKDWLPIRHSVIYPEEG